MRFYTLKDWLLKQLKVGKRLQGIVFWYLISLMVVTRKHSLDHAASISGKNRSQFGRLLKDHSGIAVLSLQDLSKRQARKFSKAMKLLKGLPWKVALIIDLTDQRRSSLHPSNATRLNHGKGYFVGHQWTNIILLIGEKIIPLPPIAFYGRTYCRERGMRYQTEHERVIEYLEALDLGEMIVDYRPEDVVVLADSGYDDKRIQNAIREKGWDFVVALKKKRSVMSDSEHQATGSSKSWRQIELFFKAHRRLKWQTIRLPANGGKKKRKEFRVRHTPGWLKGVGQAQLVCSERRNAPGRERKYFACSHPTITPTQILLAYSLRWSVELFHKGIKMHLGFQHVSTVSFESVISHVHWVYCAYLLLNGELPGLQKPEADLLERQKHVMKTLDHKDKANLLQQLTRIKGVEKVKTELKAALAA